MHGKIDVLDVITTGHTEYIPRNQLQPPESPDQKQSPKVGKTVAKRAQQKQNTSSNIVLPPSMVTDDGVPVAVMRFLEVRECQFLPLDPKANVSRLPKSFPRCKVSFNSPGRIPIFPLLRFFGSLLRHTISKIVLHLTTLIRVSIRSLDNAHPALTAPPILRRQAGCS